jgi:hypothetical protein
MNRLRDDTGQPSARVRLAAAAIVGGLVLATAPLVLVPATSASWHWLLGQLPGF